MRIVAALCWYDEPVESLERVIASVAPLVCRIVAFDGAWNGFPRGRASSAPDQERAIRDAADEHDIEALTASPETMWPSQCAKRTALYSEASVDADWILIIDADEELIIDDVSKVRRELARIDSELYADAVLVRVATTPGRGEGGGATATAPGGVRWQPRLLRADESLVVGPSSHRTLATDDVVMQCESVADTAHHAGKERSRRATIRGMTIVNRTHSRTRKRMTAKLAYGKARSTSGID